MASRRNKKGNKGKKDTTPQASEEQTTNQDFTQSVQEEQKVEDVLETKPVEPVVEKTEEVSQASTEETQVTQETIPTTQEQEPEPVKTEQEETQPVESKPAEEEKVEEVAETTEVKPEVVEPSSAEEAAENTEVKQEVVEPSSAENRLFTIEGEGEQVEQHEQPEVKAEPVENKEVSALESSSVLQDSTSNPQIISFDAPSKTEDLAQSTNTLYTSTAEPVLTTSLNEKWEEIHPAKVETRVEEPPVVQKRESVDESAFEKKTSILQGDDDIRSDRASDNAIQTRVMDEIHDASVPLFKEPSHNLTNEERIRKAEEHFREGKALKTQGKVDDAATQFNTALELLNPKNFQTADSEKLNLVHKTIQDCTLELADSYNQLNDFHQSTRFAKSLYESDANNIRAVYLYGIGLIRLGEMDQAHVLFKDFKGIGASAEDEQYRTLINKELEKLNQIADSKNKALRVSTTLEEAQPLVRHTSNPINKVPEEKQEERTDGEDKEEKSKGSGAEYFLGSLVSTSAVGFVISKYLLKFPIQKGLIVSLAVGAAVGGVSLIVRNALRKDGKGKK